MNYIGSKLSLLDFLSSSIAQVVGQSCSTFCDLFAGTGIVGSYFKKRGYQIIANDIQYYSYVLNRHYIGNHRELEFTKLVQQIPELKNLAGENRRNWVCNYLSNLGGVNGFITQNYSLAGTKKTKQPRQYFSDENAKQCDAIRQKIEQWKNEHFLTDDEYYFLLASLVESIDKYANTAAVYGAFLKKIKNSAKKSLVVKPAELLINEQEHYIFNDNSNDLIKKITSDILYLDPPYNHRQYATNYHLLETIAKYDNPSIHGKTGLRDYQKQKSLYCSKPQVKKAFSDLIENANAKYIFLSYNNEGLMDLSTIKEIMQRKGKYGRFKCEYNRFKADRTENRVYKNTKTTEYLHYVVCQ